MKGTITQFVRSGAGGATITVTVQAEHPADKSAEAIAKATADFEEAIESHDEAFKAGQTEVTLGFASAPKSRSPESARVEGSTRVDTTKPSDPTRAEATKAHDPTRAEATPANPRPQSEHLKSGR